MKILYDATEKEKNSYKCLPFFILMDATVKGKNPETYMDEIFVDHKKKLFFTTQDFLNRSKKLSSDECRQMMLLQRQFPGFDIRIVA